MYMLLVSISTMKYNDCIDNIYVRLLTRADKDLKQPLQSPTVGKENKEDIKVR